MKRLRSRRPIAIDLFAGAGGATVGLKAAGFSVRAAIDADPIALRSYEANHPEVLVVANDVRKVEPKEIARRARIPQRGLDLLNACPPCQGFSSLGKGNADDERNDLVLDVWRFVRALRPRAFVLENVPGLARDGRLRQLVRQARAVGYGVREYLEDATEFGVPQRRKRLIVLAVFGVRRNQLPVRLAHAVPRSFRRVAPSAADVLATLDHPGKTRDPLHRARNSGPAVRARIKLVPWGGSRFDLPQRNQLRCHKRLRGRVATSAYGRIGLRGPAPTMTTRCTTPACGAFVHPRQDRGITLREAALLQTFPRRYRFAGGYDEVERQIGNAMPARVARAIALVARRFSLGERSPRRVGRRR